VTTATAPASSAAAASATRRRRANRANPQAAVNPPQQRRSRDTLDRFLAAIERLLLTKDFETITVAEIVREAHSSVGAFYQRFKHKDAILPYLATRHVEEQAATAAHIFRDIDWSEISLGDRVHELFCNAVRIAREKRGLARALYRRQLLDAGALSARERELGDKVNSQVHGWLLERRFEMRHADPEEAVRVAMLFAFSAIHARFFYPDSGRARDVRLSDADLAEELTRATLAYLGADAPTGRTCPNV